MGVEKGLRPTPQDIDDEESGWEDADGGARCSDDEDGGSAALGTDMPAGPWRVCGTSYMSSSSELLLLASS